jgi:site-specific recombinase XerD
MPDLQQWFPPISEAYSIFILHCQSQRYRPSSVDFYRRRLPHFTAWLTDQGVKDLGQIHSNHIRAYLVARQDSGASAHYIHGIARALRAWFNFAVAEDWITKSPFQNVAMPRKPKKILPAFTDDEIKKIRKAAVTPRDQALVLVLLDTGIRASECVALMGADVDLKTGAVKIRAGKGEKDRLVYLGSRSIRLLLKYYIHRGQPGPADPIWLAERVPHARLTYTGLAQACSRLGEVAQIPHCTAHTFRRTFALGCLRNGMNIYALQRLMGHEDISTLKPYLAMLGTDLELAHRQHGIVDNLP